MAADDVIDQAQSEERAKLEKAYDNVNLTGVHQLSLIKKNLSAGRDAAHRSDSGSLTQGLGTVQVLSSVAGDNSVQKTGAAARQEEVCGDESQQRSRGAEFKKQRPQQVGVPANTSLPPPGPPPRGKLHKDQKHNN